MEDWTVLTALTWAKERFARIELETPRLDAEVLLAFALDLDRTSLYKNMERPLAEKELESFRDLVSRREDGSPSAYLRGSKEFMSLEFRVSPEVMIPRPETEFVVQSALEATGVDDEFTVADICTGSGNIAVSVAYYRPNSRVLAVDISPAALMVARENAARHGCADRIEFLVGDLLGPLAGKNFEGKLRMLLSNPPYVTDSEYARLPKGIRDYEPPTALLAGPNGLDALRILIAGAPKFLAPGGLLAFEFGVNQADAVKELVTETGAFEKIETIKDYGGNDRVIRAVRK